MKPKIQMSKTIQMKAQKRYENLMYNELELRVMNFVQSHLYIEIKEDEI